MKVVKSFEELQKQIAEIRSLRLGFITNFFLDAGKHAIWIEKGDCLIERVNNTLFIVKRSPSFWNVFYCSTTMEMLSYDVEAFQSNYSDKTMMYDLVGRDTQCQPLVELFKGKDCKIATSLVRMSRMTTQMEYFPDRFVRYATKADIPKISGQLHHYFDERTEQIPYDEELLKYANENHILVCEDKGEIIGFLIFELNATTQYLRYWFTHPNYRDCKVGSRMLRQFFEDGKGTRRQLFWVIQTNENAIVRYRHYGFMEENMYDYVMQFN